MPQNKNDVMKYWEKRGQNETLNDSVRLGGSAGFREHPVWFSALPLLLDHPAGGRKIRRVADMGCGTGIIAEYLARLGYEVIAVDFADSRVELAKQRLLPYPLASVRLGDVLNPPIDPGEVDAVISRNLIWLLPEPKAVISRWAELTGRNGRIAAIDCTRRLDHRKRRHHFDALHAMFKNGMGFSEHSASMKVAGEAPLANIQNSGVAASIWRESGLSNVRANDLSWISAVKHHYESPLSRALALSKYYSVIGDCQS